TKHLKQSAELSTGCIGMLLGEKRVGHRYRTTLELVLKDERSPEKEKGHLLLRLVKRLQLGLWSMVSRFWGHTLFGANEELFLGDNTGGDLREKMSDHMAPDLGASCSKKVFW
ncbi:hypothetical protein STEG23_006272, partial [Scotinomys teguina]